LRLSFSGQSSACWSTDSKNNSDVAEHHLLVLELLTVVVGADRPFTRDLADYARLFERFTRSYLPWF
jgi:hypothetical protein